MDDRNPEDALRRWVATWRVAGAALYAIERDALARVETAPALAQLADAFDHAIRHAVPTTTSPATAGRRHSWMRYSGRTRRASNTLAPSRSPIAAVKEEPEIMEGVLRLRAESERSA